MYLFHYLLSSSPSQPVPLLFHVFSCVGTSEFKFAGVGTIYQWLHLWRKYLSLSNLASPPPSLPHKFLSQRLKLYLTFSSRNTYTQVQTIGAAGVGLVPHTLSCCLLFVYRGHVMSQSRHQSSWHSGWVSWETRSTGRRVTAGFRWRNR